ncbi:hypothetical protein PRIPAC_85373 [Pristionchus pacificus]|uniref:Uncharacterized protein n=1 Tax=Pristionchus pacificus TaxID=54126 RepID=A0A2A6BTU7_PRIPA|nr:hypothetical protein PRIPAC_85373 [Pristionchus pacificus]|eukprot:PDM69277.1 hypothetical protein PRIPAC_47579 [Pristionchus pacificus]
MSYVLVKGADQLTLIDNSMITKGARSRGMTITYKTKKGLSSGTYIDIGTLTEMSGKKKQMEEETKGKKKRGRKRKEITVGFTVHPPHGGMMGDGEDNEEDPLGDNAMMEEEEDQMESKRILRGRVHRAPSMREDSPHIESDTSPHSSPNRRSSPIHRPPIRRSSPIPHSLSTTLQKGRTHGSVDTSDLRSLLQEQLAPLTSSLHYLRQSVIRLEDSAADDTNAIEGIKVRDRNITNNLEKVAANLEKVVDALPETSNDFDYKYVAKDIVDLHDANENLMIFATRIDEIIFPNERHLRLEMRDPRKVKWLYELLCHRRKISLGPDRTQRMKQVKNRLNGNVYKFNHKRPSINPPPRDLPRSQNGRFVQIQNTVVHTSPSLGLTPIPVFVNGQWMTPIRSQFHSQSSSLVPITYSIPSSNYHRILNNPNDSTNGIVARSPSMTPRISNQSPFDNGYDNNSEEFMDDDSRRESPNFIDDNDF